jgi:hypothetical protein
MDLLNGIATTQPKTRSVEILLREQHKNLNLPNNNRHAVDQEEEC